MMKLVITMMAALAGCRAHDDDPDSTSSQPELSSWLTGGWDHNEGREGQAGER